MSNLATGYWVVDPHAMQRCARVSGEWSWKIQNTLLQTFHKEATTIAGDEFRRQAVGCQIN
jgi:hypothetical protein